METKRQVSDTILIGILLAVVGGFLDAYTYLCRGEVFANAQTGNIVLLGIKIINGEYFNAVYYLLPIVAFVLGIFIAEMIRKHSLKLQKIHWRQIILLIEAVVIGITIFIPKGNMNMLCNILISFVCSLQIQSFRTFLGNPYTSTICTGNLRSATEYLFHYTQTKEKKTLNKSLQYYLIIFFFIIGACLGAFFTNMLGVQASFVVVLILFITTLFMFKEQVG